jgi:hypothetical protein
MNDIVVGYGKGEIEPGIAPLVAAMIGAGFTTFSSCEGHPHREDGFNRFPCASFYAGEAEAREVQVALVALRKSLRCSWVLRAGFVMPRGVNTWTLGWTLENGGINDCPDGEDFETQTVEVGRAHDLPLLIGMFGALQAPGKA